MVKPPIQKRIKTLVAQFDLIKQDRKVVLRDLADTLPANGADLNFICTHNARRSQLAQVWAQTAAYYYGFKNIRAFSGGTEVSSVNPNTLRTLETVGFEVTPVSSSVNPHYHVKFSDVAAPVHIYSKKIDDASNPQANFIAVMTCSHADENCPIVTGAAKRIALTYEDPGRYDKSEKALEMYLRTSDEIAREILYVFSTKAESILKP